VDEAERAYQDEDRSRGSADPGAYELFVSMRAVGEPHWRYLFPGDEANSHLVDIAVKRIPAKDVPASKDWQGSYRAPPGSA
jgi:hypothetical protein